MKKLLAILSSFGLVVTSTTGVVACGTVNVDKITGPSFSNADLKELLKSTIAKLEIAVEQNKDSDEEIISQINQALPKARSVLNDPNASSNDLATQNLLVNNLLLNYLRLSIDADDLSSLDQQLLAVKNQLEQANKTITGLKQAESKLKAQISSTGEQITTLIRQKEALEVETSQNQEQIKELESNIAKLTITKNDLDSQLLATSNQIKELAAEVRDFDAQVKTLTEQIGTLTGQKTTLEGTIVAKQAEQIALQVEIDQKEVDLNTLTDKYLESAKKVRGLQSEINAVQTNISETESLISSLEEILQSLAEEIATAHKTNEVLTAKRDQLKLDIAFWKEKNQALEENRKELLEELNNKQVELNVLKEQIVKVQQELLDNAAANLQIEAAIKDVEAEEAEVDQQIASLTGSIEIAQAEKTRLEGLVQAAQAQKESLNQAISDLNQAIGDLTTQKSNLANEITRSEETLSNQQAEIDRLTEANVELNRQIDQKVTANKGLEEEVASNNILIEQLNQEIQNHEQAIKSTQDWIDQAKPVRDQLLAEQEQAEQERDAIKKALEDATVDREAKEVELSEKEAQLEILKIKLADLNGQIDNNQEVINDKSLEKEQLSAGKTALETRNQALSAEIEANKQAIESLVTQNDDLNHKIQIAQQTVENLENEIQTNQTQLTELINIIAAHEQEIGQLTIDLTNATQEADKQAVLLETAQDKQAQLTEEKNLLVTQQTDLIEKIAQLEQKISALKADEVIKNETLVDLQAQYDEANVKATDLMRECEQLGDEANRVAEKIAGLDQEIRDHQEMIDDNEITINRLQGEKTTANQRMESLQTANQTAETLKEALEKQVIDLEEILAQQSIEIAELKETKTTLVNQDDQLVQELGDLSDEFTRVENLIKQYQGTTKDLNEIVIPDLLEKIKQAQADNLTAAQALETTNKAISDLQAEIRKISADEYTNHKTIEALKAEISNLEAWDQELNDTLNALKPEYEKASDLNEELQAKNSQLLADKSNLIGDNKAKQSEIDALTKNNQDLKDQIMRDIKPIKLAVGIDADYQRENSHRGIYSWSFVITRSEAVQLGWLKDLFEVGTVYPDGEEKYDVFVGFEKTSGQATKKIFEQKYGPRPRWDDDGKNNQPAPKDGFFVELLPAAPGDWENIRIRWNSNLAYVPSVGEEYTIKTGNGSIITVYRYQ